MRRRRPLAVHQTPEPRGGGGCGGVGGGAQDTNASAAASAPFRVQRSVAAVSNSPTQASTAEERNVRGGEGYHRVTVLSPPLPRLPMSCQKHIPPPPPPPLLYAAPTGAQSRLCEVAWKVFVDSAHLSGTTAADATAERVQPLLSLPPSPTSSPSPPSDGGEKTTPTTKRPWFD